CAQQISRGRFQKKTSRTVFVTEKGLNLVAQFGIARTGLFQKLHTISQFQGRSVFVNAAYLLPTLGVHGEVVRSSSRYSHTRAVFQSRLTVEGEMPSTSEVSSMESPAKKRSSTTRLCCGSSRARLCNASSRAITSTSAAAACDSTSS